PVLLHVVAPVFGIAALGFLAARMGIMKPAGVEGMVAFVFNLAIPALLLRSMAGLEIPQHIQWSFLVAFYAGSFTVWALGIATARLVFDRPLDEGAIFGMGAAFSNTVMVGVPVILTAFGPEASLPLFLIISFHSALFMPLTAGLIQWSRGRGVSWGEQVGELVRVLARNPIVLGLAVGTLLNLTRVALPAPVDRPLELLGAAAVPCALFAMGAAVAGYPFTGDLRPGTVLSALKLLVHPLVVWAVGLWVLHLDGLWLSVAVMTAAMPSGINVYLFAARYDAAAAVAARTVLLSSLFSVVTLSTLLVLLRG
ncbi:MAG: AEC family transporter, partial [Gemmatimonadetes bacterium]|nr:AEC family transporter [Gemmatimonadota bacterium]